MLDSKVYGEQEQKKSKKKTLTVFKYTVDGQIYESVILKGTPVFVTIDTKNNNQVTFLDKIEETTRVLIPPAIEDYPSGLPYTFESKEEITDIISMINNQHISIDILFLMIREHFSKFIVHHTHVLDYISALPLFSYFQDRFPTVPILCLFQTMVVEKALLVMHLNF
jgi:hypothetical protein